MNLDPLLSAPHAIQIHVFTVVPAAVLGTYILAMKKGTARHKLLGKVWLVLMVASAFSSFFIHTIRSWGEFSPIHLISLWVIIASFLAIRTARKGNIRAHRSYILGMYIGGILGAGAFTLLPGRIMNAVFLSGLEMGTMPNGTVLAFALALIIFFVFAAREALRAR